MSIIKIIVSVSFVGVRGVDYDRYGCQGAYTLSHKLLVAYVHRSLLCVIAITRKSNLNSFFPDYYNMILSWWIISCSSFLLMWRP